MNAVAGGRRRVFAILAVTLMVLASGGGGYEWAAVSAATGQDGSEATGEITGTLAGEAFVRYTVGRATGDVYINTATWSEAMPMPFPLPGFPAYRVSLQGHRSVRGLDWEQAITLEFYLDADFNLYESDMFDDAGISYFPDGLTFDIERVYTMEEGGIDVTEVIKHGDRLEVNGSFAGTLMRWEFTDRATFDGFYTDPMEIRGEFHVHNVTYSDN